MKERENLTKPYINKGVNFARQMLIGLTLFGPVAEARQHSRGEEPAVQLLEQDREDLKLRTKWKLLESYVENYQKPYHQERLKNFESQNARRVMLWKQQELDAKEKQKEMLSVYVERLIYLKDALKELFLEIESVRDSYNRVDIHTVLRGVEEVNNATFPLWEKERDVHLAQYYNIIHLITPIVGAENAKSEDFWRGMQSEQYTQFDNLLLEYQYTSQFLVGADYAVEANLRDLKSNLEAFKALPANARKEILLRAELGQLPQKVKGVEDGKRQIE